MTSVINFISTLDNAQIKGNQIHFYQIYLTTTSNSHFQKGIESIFIINCPLYSKYGNHSLLVVHRIWGSETTLKGYYHHCSLIKATPRLLTVHVTISFSLLSRPSQEGVSLYLNSVAGLQSSHQNGEDSHFQDSNSNQIFLQTE